MYLVRCINVWYITSECLFVIGAETAWEEFAENVMNPGVAGMRVSPHTYP